MNEEQIREMIREEARKLIRENLTIHISESYGHYSDRGIKVEIYLENDLVSSDSVSIPRD